MWIIVSYGIKGYDTEVSEAKTYEEALGVYSEEVKRVNPRWSGSIVIAKIEQETKFNS